MVVSECYNSYGEQNANATHTRGKSTKLNCYGALCHPMLAEENNFTEEGP